MFSVCDISSKVAELGANRIDADAFEDWFVSTSWGNHDVKGGTLSEAIATVYRSLSRLDSGELDEAALADELKTALRPFESQTMFVVGSPRKKGPRSEDGLSTTFSLRPAFAIT